METCPVIPLRNITMLDNANVEINESKESKVEVISPKPDIEIIKEQLSEKKEIPKTTPVLGNKNVKIKKIRTKKIGGEKRKFSEKHDLFKKVKRKKVLTGESPMAKEPNKEDKDVTLTPESKNDDTVVSNTNGENLDIKQKSKQMSSRKSKAIENSCKETLDALLKLESEVLASMDKSFKILKSLNILNKKHVPIDTLIDLISLALETNQASEVVDTSKELTFSKIVSNLKLELCSSPKSLKARRSILLTECPKNQDVIQSDLLSETAVLPQEVMDKENVEDQNEEEKMEACEPLVELLETNLEQTVEKSGKNFCITNYFKKLKKTVEERDKNERFSCFTTKADMFLAPKLGGELTGDRRERFEQEFINQTCEVQNLFKDYPKCLIFDKSKGKKNQENSLTSDKNVGVLETVNEPEVVMVSEVEQGTLVQQSVSNLNQRKKITPLKIDQPKFLSSVTVSRTKAKLLQFHDNRRPPYWGTWRRKSESVGPRKPFGQDKLLNYEVDSDDEWEEEEEPGESLHGSDDEKEPEEEYEVDNDFFVPHGYLSDDENPEKENMSPKTKLDLLEKQFTFEQKQKTSKMTPFVFGTFWVHKGAPPEGSIYQDLQIQNLQMVPWTATPIQIDEEDEKKTEIVSEGEVTSTVKKQRLKKTFPDEEIPQLIKMIHGSPQNSELLARKFLVYWEGDGKRSGLTKVCVLKKIKELATWQTSMEKGKRWHVPKETRKEFGADIEAESPSKKPRKCFIWKYVKKADKGGEGTPSSSTKLEPEVVML